MVVVVVVALRAFKGTKDGGWVTMGEGGFFWEKVGDVWLSWWTGDDFS